MSPSVEHACRRARLDAIRVRIEPGLRPRVEEILGQLVAGRFVTRDQFRREVAPAQRARDLAGCREVRHSRLVRQPICELVERSGVVEVIVRRQRECRLLEQITRCIVQAGDTETRVDEQTAVAPRHVPDVAAHETVDERLPEPPHVGADRFARANQSPIATGVPSCGISSSGAAYATSKRRAPVGGPVRDWTVAPTPQSPSLRPVAVAFVVFGFFAGAWAVATVDIERTFRLTDTGLGVLLAAGIIAATAITAIGGTVTDRFGAGRSLTAALLAWGSLLVLEGLAPHLVLFVPALMLTMAAGGLVDVVMNIVAADALSHDAGRLVRFHGLFNAGCVVGRGRDRNRHPARSFVAGRVDRHRRRWHRHGDRHAPGRGCRNPSASTILRCGARSRAFATRDSSSSRSCSARRR